MVLISACNVNADLTPQGRLGAVEGAVKAASMGGSVVGLCGETFVVLATFAEVSAELAYPIERMWRCDRTICVAAVGYARDALLAGDFAQEQCHNQRMTLGVSPTPSGIAESLTDAVATAARESRPIGAHLVVAGVGSCGPLLYSIEPSGRLSQLRAVALGRYSVPISKYLRKAPEPQDLADAKQILRDIINKAIKTANEDDSDYHTEEEPLLSSQLVFISENDYRKRTEPDFAWMTQQIDDSLLHENSDSSDHEVDLSKRNSQSSYTGDDR